MQYLPNMIRKKKTQISLVSSLSTQELILMFTGPDAECLTVRYELCFAGN